MGRIKTHNGQLLLWHKSCHLHPIFNPRYARENLISFSESVVLFSLYISIIIVFLHFIVLNGFLGTETITWLLIESGARSLLFWVSNSDFLSKTYIVLVLSVAIVALFPIRRLFNVAKANSHPNSKSNLVKFISKNNLATLITKGEKAMSKNIEITKTIVALKKIPKLKDTPVI